MTCSLPLPRHAPPGPAATAVSADQISPGALCALPVLITRAVASCCCLQHSLPVPYSDCPFTGFLTPSRSGSVPLEESLRAAKSAGPIHYSDGPWYTAAA